MSLAEVVANQELPDVSRATRTARPADLARVARGGVIALMAVAPFEALHPIVRLPGQSLTTVEATLLVVGGVTAWAALRNHALPRLSIPDLSPWMAFVGAALLAAVSAPRFRANALHMAIRYATIAVIFGLTVVAARSRRGVRWVMAATVAAGGAVAVLVIADFAGFDPIERFLSAFRAGVSVVGAQVRASGPFQYPTIASMYLEIAFAIGLGFLITIRRRGSMFLAVIVVLALMIEAITLTFTRSGLITVLLSLLLVGSSHWRGHGLDRVTAGTALLGAVVVAAVLSSRSAEMLRLRLTSETQGGWFSAAMDPPREVDLRTREVIGVPLAVTNTGRTSWDSTAAQPVFLSYHWIAADSDEVVWWEGERTAFSERVTPGSRVRLLARVRAPQRAGRYRLMWDLEQRNRLWFSTEPSALLYVTEARVTGLSSAMPETSGPRHVPAAAVRPGRSVLWLAAWRMFVAHPVLGLGPDNYRLSYGDYVTVPKADPRVHSNNMYLELLTGTGAIGLVCAGWVGVRVARRCVVSLRRPSARAGIAAACAAIAVHGLVDSFLGFTGTYIAIAVALGLAASPGLHRGHAHRV
jgi:O-antigen ligase